MTDQPALVYGESVADLMPALIRLRDGLRVTPDGSYRFRFTLPSEEAAPLVRALKRAEAEILLEEADLLQGVTDKQPDQRSAEALVRVVTSLPAAKAKAFFRSERHQRHRSA